MADVSFEFIGLDELEKDLSDVVNKYPDETNRFMRRQGTAFVKDVREKMPGSWKNNKAKVPPGLAKNWRRDVWEDSGHHINQVEIRCKSPHWHLLENGHNMVVGSKKKNNLKKVGYVSGFHYCEKTRGEWAGKFPGNISEYVDGMLKQHNL